MATFVILTDAPGTICLSGSLTVPVIVPRASWAVEEIGEARAMARKTAVINREPAPIDFIFIVCLLKSVQCRITALVTIPARVRTPKHSGSPDSKVDLDPELDVAR